MNFPALRTDDNETLNQKQTYVLCSYIRYNFSSSHLTSFHIAVTVAFFVFLCVLAHASLPNKVCNLLHYLTPLLYLEEISGEEGPISVCHLLSKPKQHIGSHFLRIKRVLSAQK